MPWTRVAAWVGNRDPEHPVPPFRLPRDEATSPRCKLRRQLVALFAEPRAFSSAEERTTSRLAHDRYELAHRTGRPNTVSKRTAQCFRTMIQGLPGAG